MQAGQPRIKQKIFQNFLSLSFTLSLGGFVSQFKISFTFSPEKKGIFFMMTMLA